MDEDLDFGGFLNDPDEVALTNPQRDQLDGNIDDQNQSEDPLNEALNQADLISEEEASQVRDSQVKQGQKAGPNNAHVEDDFHEVEYANNQHILNKNLVQPDIAHMSFLKEFQEFSKNDPEDDIDQQNGVKDQQQTSRSQKQSNSKRNLNSKSGGRNSDVYIDGDNTSIKSSFMCCYIEHQKQDDNQENGSDTGNKRIGLNCTIF
eukprot:403347539